MTKMYQGEGVVKRIFDRGGPVLLFFLASPMITAQITLPLHPPPKKTNMAPKHTGLEDLF